MGKDYKDWYQENKAALSAKRKERYNSDPEYRQAIIDRQRAQRASNPARKSDGVIFKLVGGVDRRVYRIGDMSEMAGVPLDTLRSWERKGIMPKPSVGGVHRYYTQSQIELVALIATTLKEVRYKPAPIRKQATTTVVTKVAALWEQYDGH